MQHPDIKVSTLAKVECYLCKALDARKKDASYCRAYYSLYTKVEKEKSQERIDFVCAWIFHKNASNSDKEKRAQQRQLLCPMM